MVEWKTLQAFKYSGEGQIDFRSSRHQQAASSTTPKQTSRFIMLLLTLLPHSTTGQSVYKITFEFLYILSQIFHEIFHILFNVGYSVARPGEIPELRCH